MKGIVVYRENQSVPQLVWEEVPSVSAGQHEVLVRIHATAINRADLLQARGGYPPPAGASDILGLEMAGQIVELGEGVTEWEVGDRVCALLPGGGYAEFVAVPDQMLLRLPEAWSFSQGAAVPEVWYTAFVNLFMEGNLREGEIALIHAGGSGVGTAAIQLVREAGAIPYMTAGSQAKLDRGMALGAKLAVNYKEDDFVSAVLEASDGRGADVILDPVGANYLGKNLQALAHKGRIIQIGLLSGAVTEINLGLVMGKMARLIGSRLRSRPLSEKIAITEAFRTRFWDKLVDGTMQPIIDTTFPIEQATAAHTYIRDNRNIGKVILTID